MDAICTRIEQLRRDNSLSQSELSEKIDISIATYTNLMRSCDFRISHIKKMAEVFGVPVKYFFEEMKDSDIRAEELKREISKLTDENNKLQQLSDLYSGLIDNTAESFRIIFMASQFLGEWKISDSILANNDNSIKFIGDFNDYIKNNSDKWIEGLNNKIKESERIREELRKMSKSQKFMVTFKRFFKIK